ncbi:biotin-dependent carboxyltransferase family protein [Paraflavitalea pollutisoli]|uniref:5-oxoprolinase subunit C family protein n=1 Tax=Paraflavitalea pollutisoli TaxID=3034143 RepID=UPI0023EC722A|nr:biotin-dependent carboxyltransferase family protein [Paraflavitalea sp. H1-2-19X]
MSLTIIKPGLLDTIQDLGRPGYSCWGINPGGVMDGYAARIANMLVGNDPGAAVMEIHFPAAQILFEQNALISITGADFTPTLNDNELVSTWRPIVVRRNTILHFPQWVQGSRCYLAVHGGFCVPQWLDSYSTNLKAGVGGFHGRKLEKGDELPFKENSIYFAGLLKETREYQPLNWRVDTGRTYQLPHEIKITTGHEWSQLSAASQRDMLDSNFIIHPFSDRMGYQLRGVPLKRQVNTELLSSGVSFGTVQLLPDGQLILLMADHQTTGGYPRVAHVISSQLPKLAQLRPSDSIQFQLVDTPTAEELLFSQEHELSIIQRACHDHLNQLVW